MITAKVPYSFNLRVVSSQNCRSLRAPRGIFGSMREEVAENWRKLHDEELRNL